MARQAAPAPPGAAPGSAHTAPGASGATAKGLTHAEFTPGGGAPQTAGTVSVTRAGSEVVLSSPKITAEGSVAWKAPATPAGGGAPPPRPPGTPDDVRVGWINTLLEGDRVFTYTADGSPGGKVVREERGMAPAGGRDAMFDNDRRTGRQVPHRDSEAPFYSATRRVRPGEKTDLVPFVDEPGTGAPLEVHGAGGEKGRLAKVSGADRFRLSIGVAEVGDPASIHLTAKEWAVPWDVTVSEAGTGAGGPIAVEDYKGRLEDIRRGQGYVVGEAERFPWPRSPEEVKAFTTDELIKATPYAERRDTAAWTLMCQELRARNPACRVSVTVNASTALVMDAVAVTVKGPRTATKTVTEWLGPASVSFRLLELCDPQDLRTGMTLELSVAVEGGTPQPMTWPWPFGPLAPTCYWSDAADTPRGEWTDPGKGVKRDVRTDVEVSATGFA